MDNTRAKFKELLENSNVSMDQIAREIEWRIPKKLYRYMSFDNYWTNNLFKGEVVLKKPSEFNDPFDCYLNIDINKFWDTSGKKLFYKEHGMNISMNKHYGQDSDLSIFFGQDRMRVACFAESWKTLLMWSHYADSHKGLCIEYDTSLMSVKKFLFPIIYQNELYNATNDFCYYENNLFNFLFFKSNEWKYENEWRIAVMKEQINDKMYDNGCELYKLIMKNCISAVYIGLKADDSNIEKIKNADVNFKIYKAKKSSNNFCLEKEAL